MTPAQKALEQFLVGLAITAVITGFYAVVPMLAVSSTPDWRAVLNAFGIAVIYALANGLYAYVKAHGIPTADALPPPAQPNPVVVIHTAPAPPQGGDATIPVSSQPQVTTNEKPPTTLP